jgi:hypothetical protein
MMVRTLGKARYIFVRYCNKVKMMEKIKSMSEFFVPTRFACLKSWQSRVIIFILLVINCFIMFLVKQHVDFFQDGRGAYNAPLF